MQNDPYASTFRRINYEDEDLEERLASKTSRLKQITISLNDELKNSNKLLNDLDTDFDKSKGFLGMTINRVVRLSKSGGSCKIYLYLILFSMLVFFVLYLVIKFN
jgi:blocked-early-in-transport protein 1